MYFDITKKNNLKYSVEYDTEESHNCDEYGCDPYCHCGVIDRIIVKYDKKTSFNFVNEFWKDMTTPSYLSSVLAERYLSRRITSDDFTYEACRGYYGEELDSITLENRSALDEFEGFSDNTERLYEWLTLEYGRVLPEIYDACSFWKLDLINISDIEDRTLPKLNKSFLLENYLTEIKKPGKSKTGATAFVQQHWIHKDHSKYFAPLCLPTKDGKYRLIDGRHRFFAYQQIVEVYPKSYKDPVRHLTHKKIWAIVPDSSK